MITYVDTSTLLKLVVDEPGSEVAGQIWLSSDALVSVGLIEVEARAALGSAKRSGRLSAAEHRRAVRNVQVLLDQVDVIDVTDAVVASACELAERHGLRGYDAVHLAGARLAGSDVLMSADVDLCRAAEREGIAVANPLAN